MSFSNNSLSNIAEMSSGIVLAHRQLPPQAEVQVPGRVVLALHFSLLLFLFQLDFCCSTSVFEVVVLVFISYFLLMLNCIFYMQVRDIFFFFTINTFCVIQSIFS